MIKNRKRPNTPIHIEIWIASRLLSEKKNVFSKRELTEFIDHLFSDRREGTSTHISSCCVANKPSNHLKNYNYLTWVSRGVYKIFSEGDYIHPDKNGCQTCPGRESIPQHFLHLLNKTYNGIALSESPANKTKKHSSPSKVLDKPIDRIDFELLQKYEKESIENTLLMMAYNPSCARIFTTAVNKQIKKKIISIIELLPEVETQVQFNNIHKNILDEIVDNINNHKTKNPSGKISYGQAQKGLNVFLKVYVDWAKLPSLEISEKITEFLHCPLDRVVMKTIKKREKILFREFGNLPCDLKNIITYEQYINWQYLIDRILQEKDIEQKRTLIDVIWYLESLKKK
jgi:hypothetical protein